MKPKKQLSAHAVRLLRKTQEMIRRFPKRYNQNNDDLVTEEPTCKSPPVYHWVDAIP